MLRLTPPLHWLLSCKFTRFRGNIFMDKPQPPSIPEIIKRWHDFAPVYTAMESGPQTFFFSLINQLKIQRANNILEIACGSGLLLPHVLDLKKQEAQYVATDISPTMIEKARQRLEQHYSKYQSKLSFEEWLKKVNLVIIPANGEEAIVGFAKFDTVILNLVLMLTSEPKKILTNAYNVSTSDAVMGITIWGEKSKNNFTTIIGRAIKELGLELLQKRSPFYYQEVIHQHLQETGWEVVFEWEQQAPFPFTEPSDLVYYFTSLTETFQLYTSEEVEKIKQKSLEIFNTAVANKQPMLMSNKLFIVRKTQ